jgi:DNA/RNA-binding domain of Phe-tRNA-synthetase-like protein
MLSLAPELGQIVRPGLLAFERLRVVEREPALDALLAEAERAVRIAPPSEIAEVRAMYRAVGIDPTRRRPSSEALLRRVVRGEMLPRINSLVDTCNWCSLEFQLPYGLYDLDRVSEPIELRLGREGEQYAGIRKDEVHVAGRLTLADRVGPFGNPSSDSARTMVLPGAARALVVVFAPFQLPEAQLAAVLETTSKRILDITGGREMHRSIARMAS